MNLTFKPMTVNCAEQMLRWVYDPPYESYGYLGDDPEWVVTYLTDPENRFYAVLDGEEFIGFRSFGADGQVEGGHYDTDYLDVGGGLKPELTGQGLGAGVLQAGLRFGQRAMKTDRFRATVAAFNKRALEVVRRVGFAEQSRFARVEDLETFVILTIDLEV